MPSEKNKTEKDVPAYKSPGFGFRHMQIMMMTLCATVIYVMRSSMSIAVLAMTDPVKVNDSSVEIYEWSEEIRGVILSSFYWGYTLMQIPMGVLGERFGGKPLLMTALLVNGVLCLATPSLAKLGGWIAVCLVRMGMGLTQACFMPSNHTLLGRWAPPQERSTLGMISYAGIQVGTVMTMPICAILSQTSLRWRMIFYTMGTLSLFMAVLWWTLTASSPREHRWIRIEERMYIESSLQSSGKKNPPIPWKKILTSRPLMATAATHVGVNWCFIILLVILPTYLRNGLHMDMTSGSLVSALPFLAQWGFSFVSSILSDYLYNNKILSLSSCRKLFNTIAAIGTGGSLLVIAFLNKDQAVLAVVIMTFAGGILGCSTAGYMLNHIDLAPNFGGVMFSITNCFANLIGILTPLSTGVILGDHPEDLTSWRIVFSLGAFLIIAGDIIFVLFGTSELQDWNNEETEVPYEYGEVKKEFLNNSMSEMKEKTYEFSENKS